MASTVEELIAEAEVRAIHLRYCRAADRLDLHLFRSCFHENAQFDLPVYKGGVEGFIAMAWETLRGFEATRYFTGNQLVEVMGERAWAEHYTVATHRIKASQDGPMRDDVANVRYIDQLEFRDAWRIVRRTLLLDMSRTDAVPDLLPAPREPDGRGDRTDLSYVLRDSLAAGPLPGAVDRPAARQP
jgi:hypothetical protein